MIPRLYLRRVSFHFSAGFQNNTEITEMLVFDIIFDSLIFDTFDFKYVLLALSKK